MNLQSLLAGLVHGLGLASQAAVLGGLVLERLIIPADVPELTVARARLRHWITACLLLLVLTTIGELVMRTQAMSRAPLAVAVVTLPTVIAHTHLGLVLTIRSAVLVLAVLLSLVQAAALRALCLLVTLGVALTASLTGHAAAWGDLTVNTAVDWLHAVAASAWAGGLFGLAGVVWRQQPPWPLAAVVVVARRFSRLAGVCLLVVVLTGSYNAWSQLGAVARLWTSPYGRVLLVKLLVVAVLVWLGAVNRYVLLPRLSRHRTTRGIGARLFRLGRLVILGPTRGAQEVLPPVQLAVYVAWEALLALAVFACTAALSEATPGRHTAFERKLTTHVAPVQARSTSSASGVGTVTPPPGDAARGRTVFVKLQCFTCHTVPGADVPAPSQPGPDLTEVGRRHPGYLVESILNPNAMIVDGPGYTDARGLSIMPEYRNELTVGELIDLVAYLKSL